MSRNTRLVMVEVRKSGGDNKNGCVNVTVGDNGDEVIQKNERWD